MAPEVIKSETIKLKDINKIDLFSLGVILYRFAFCCYPFDLNHEDSNDTIYETFGIISSGYLRTDEALSLLMLGPEYIQVALKTEKAASQLTWLKADQITAESEKNMKELLKKEQEAFQQEFAEKMQRFL